MNENIVNAIIIDGNTYNVLPNGVKCPNCAVRDYCLKGKLGSAITFDCASIHLEIASISLSDEILDDIYSDMEADQALMFEQSGIYA